MFERYLLIAVIIIALWLIGFIAYVIVSRRQQDIESELEHLQQMLDRDPERDRTE